MGRDIEQAARVEAFIEHAERVFRERGSLIFCSGKTLRPADLRAFIEQRSKAEASLGGALRFWVIRRIDRNYIEPTLYKSEAPARAAAASRRGYDVIELQAVDFPPAQPKAAAE